MTEKGADLFKAGDVADDEWMDKYTVVFVYLFLFLMLSCFVSVSYSSENIMDVIFLLYVGHKNNK